MLYIEKSNLKIWKSEDEKWGIYFWVISNNYRICILTFIAFLIQVVSISWHHTDLRFSITFWKETEHHVEQNKKICIYRQSSWQIAMHLSARPILYFDNFCLIHLCVFKFSRSCSAHVCCSAMSCSHLDK